MKARALITLLLILMSCGFAYGLPKGKPFVELNDQIVEVQGILRTMEERFTELLGRVELIENTVDRTSAAIVSLESENALLQSIANDLSLGLVEILDAQIRIEAEIDILEIETELNGDALGTLEQEIKSLTEVMTLLDATTGESVEYLSERIAENDILIGILSQRQEELEEQLALKQDLLSGTCPDGEAMIGIDVEGSLLCESFIKGSLIKTIYRTGVHKVQGARGYEIDMGILKCDNLIGGGAQVPRQVQRVSPYKYSAAYLGAPAYYGYAYLNSSPWHPDFAQPGSEIYWKFWIDCLQLPEPWTVDVVGD